MPKSADARPENADTTARTDAASADDRSDDGRWANRGVTPRANQGTGWVVVAD